MNLSIIKQVSIKGYLASIGCNIEIDRGYYGMYRSPYREDCEASLKVDYNLNLWYDFGGNNDSGSIIDLIMKMKNYSFTEAISYLRTEYNDEDSFSFHRKQTIVQKNRIEIKKVKSLENKALLQYLESRKINLKIAQHYCQEVYYSVNNKQYFAIAFQNDSGSFELRNIYFKGSTGKNVTHLNNNSNRLFLFEGFVDFLSFLTYEKIEQELSFDVIVLNSVSNIEKAKIKFGEYNQIYLLLDNDSVGKKYTSELIAEFKQAEDYSHFYSYYKDLNDFLIAQNELNSKTTKFLF